MLKKFFKRFKIENPTKPAVDAVVKAMLERPETFIITDHYMTDTKTKYVYWIGYSVGIHSPYKLDFTGLQGRKFKKMVDNLKIYQLKSELKKVRV